MDFNLIVFWDCFLFYEPVSAVLWVDFMIPIYVSVKYFYEFVLWLPIFGSQNCVISHILNQIGYLSQINWFSVKMNKNNLISILAVKIQMYLLIVSPRLNYQNSQATFALLRLLKVSFQIPL